MNVKTNDGFGSFFNFYSLSRIKGEITKLNIWKRIVFFLDPQIKSAQSGYQDDDYEHPNQSSQPKYL